MDWQREWRTFTAISSGVAAHVASELPKVVAQIPKLVKDHKIPIIAVASGIAIVALPILIAGPLLGLIGFGSSGIIAGSIAAVIHSHIGAVAAGSLFAILQSAAMGGHGMLIGGGVVQVIGGVIAMAGGVDLLTKALDGSMHRVQLRGLEALDVENLPSRVLSRDEVAAFVADERSTCLATDFITETSQDEKKEANVL